MKTAVNDSLRYCLILPHYNHVREFSVFLPQLLSLDIPCIVADDGSDTEEFEKLEALLAEHDDIQLISHQHNRGKGAAVMTAASYARTLGMTHVFQVDADGQHNPQDIARFIEASRKAPESIICGQPVFDSSAPRYW